MNAPTIPEGAARTSTATREASASPQRASGTEPALDAERCARSASALLEQQRYVEAAEAYDRLLAMDATHRAGRLHLAICLEKTGRWGEAAEQFRLSREADPDRPEARLGLAICQLHLGRPSDALLLFDEALRIDPEDPTARSGKAMALSLLQDDGVSGRPNTTSIAALLTSVTAPDKPTPDAQERLAMAALLTGEFEEATARCRQLVLAEPGHGEAWFNLGVALHQTGRLPEAHEAFSRAAELRPRDWRPALQTGMASHLLGDTAGARAAYERVLRDTPDCPEALWNFSLLLEQESEWQRAEELQERLAKREPLREECWFRLGVLRLRRGDAAGASAAFATCLERRREWPEASLNLGIALREQGRRDEAREAFEAALAVHPGAAEALRGLACLTVEDEDHERALQLHQRLTNVGSPCAELSFNLGVLLEELGRLRLAAQLYRQAIAERPLMAEAHLNLGHVLREQGRDAEARACWCRAVELDPSLAVGYFDPRPAS